MLILSRSDSRKEKKKFLQKVHFQKVFSKGCVVFECVCVFECVVCVCVREREGV